MHTYTHTHIHIYSICVFVRVCVCQQVHSWLMAWLQAYRYFYTSDHEISQIGTVPFIITWECPEDWKTIECLPGVRIGMWVLGWVLKDPHRPYAKLRAFFCGRGLCSTHWSIKETGAQTKEFENYFSRPVVSNWETSVLPRIFGSVCRYFWLLRFRGVTSI